MRAAPSIKPWHEEYTLSDTSWTGLRLLVNGSLSCVAGCPRERTWPDTSMRAHCIWPASGATSVIVDWEFREHSSGNGCGSWYPVLEEVSTGTVREILIEHAERARQIHLLEQHLEVQEAA